VGQTDLQVGTLVHDPAEDKRGEGDRAIDQIADGVGQVIALRTLHHQRGPGLVDEDQGTHLLRGFPEGQKLRLIKAATVDVVVDHGPFEAKSDHGPFQFGDGGLGVLHRQGG
jgi:hypothetical protein